MGLWFQATYMVFGRVKITENTSHIMKSIAHNFADMTYEILDIVVPNR